MNRRTKKVALLALVVSLGLVAAACGDDDDDTTAPAAETTAASAGGEVTTAPAADDPAAAGIAAAQAFVDEYTGTPDSIGAFEALPAAPEAGKTFFWAECNFPVCGSIGDGIEEAATAVGWDFIRATYDPSDPANVGNTMQQAIDQNADFIGITGRPLSEFENAAQQAIEAGIPIFDGYTQNEVDPEGTGIWSCWGCPDQDRLTMAALANWIIVDSGGKANVIFSNIPDFPILVFREQIVKETLEANCPGCTITVINNSIQDLVEGAIPGKIVSAVETAPEGSYVAFSFGDQGFGTVDALETAGLLERAKIFVHDPNIADLNNLKAGKIAAASTNTLWQVGYMYIDAALRVDQDVWDDSYARQIMPFEILTPTSEGVQLAIDFDTAKGGVASPYVGVPDFIEQFQALWKVA